MSRMGGNGFPYKWRLLSDDPYVLNPRNDHFEGCDPSKDVVVCEMK